MRNSSRSATKRARTLRHEMGATERTLWHHLRKQQLGFRFRRQYPIGPYVIDFFCVAAKLAIEVDGEHHDRDLRIDRDRQRDAWLLNEHDIQTLRFRTIDIIENIDAVREQIYRHCCERTGRNPLDLKLDER